MRYEVSLEKDQYGFYELIAIYNEVRTSCYHATIFVSRDRNRLVEYREALTKSKTVLNVKNRRVEIL